MDNVINLASYKKEDELPVDDFTDPAQLFIRYHLLPWAVDNNIDIYSQSFKLNGATIMTCIQGMLLG